MVTPMCPGRKHMQVQVISSKQEVDGRILALGTCHAIYFPWLVFACVYDYGSLIEAYQNQAIFNE